MNKPQLERAPESPVSQVDSHLPMLTRKDSEVDLRGLYDLFWSGKWIILGFMLLAAVLGGCYLVVVPPTFTADGMVEVEQDQKSGNASSLNDISSLLLGTPVQTEAEIQILKSRMVLADVVSKLNLLILAVPRTFPIIGSAYFRLHQSSEPLEVPSWLRRYAWGGEKIDLPTLLVPERFYNKKLTLRATSQGYELFDSDRNLILSGHIGETVTSDTPDGPVTIFVRDLQALPGTEFQVWRFAEQDVLRSLGNKVAVAERGRQSGVIGINVSGATASFVANVVNGIEDAYVKQNVERRSAEAKQSLDFLEKQIPQLKTRVNLAQQQLNDYQLKQGSVDVTKETEALLQHSVELETQRMTLAQQREEALQRFTPEHPMIKAINENIAAIEAAQQKVKDQSQKLPTTQQEILGLMRDLDVANQLYTAMMNSVQQLQVAKAGTVGNVRIVDYAMKPLRRSAPNTTAVLSLSIFVGLILGIGYISIQRALLRGVDDPAELEAELGLTAYASIPFTGYQRQLIKNMGGKSEGAESYLLALTNGKDMAVEALRSLRNSLQFLMLESANNVVMLSGPAPGVGKSFVTANLGALLAISGKKVVIVDADLRLGHLSDFARLDSYPGVSDFVVGKATEEEVVRPMGVDGLMLVSNGTTPPNPAEVLMHDRFGDLIQSLSQKFDYVILDTPPVLLVADAAIAGRTAGCALLVLKSAEHRMREIEESYRRFAQAGVNVRGVIFNQVGYRVGSYGYGGYGYGYGYGYGSKGYGG